MKRKILVLLLVLVLVSMIISCSQSPSVSTSQASTKTTENTAKVIELNYNKQGPAVQQVSQEPAEYIANEVAKRTEGRVKINIFPNSGLANPAETYDALLKGVSDIGEANANSTPGRFPASEVFEMPLGYPDVWVASQAINDWYAKFKPKEYEGTTILYLNTTTPYTIGTVNKPIRKLEDLKGLNIRSSGTASDKYVSALGATPRALNVTECYEALSKSMVDGLLMPMEAYPSFKFDEVIKYVTDWSFGSYSAVSYIAINNNSFNKLSEKDKKTLLDIGQEARQLRCKLFLAETDRAISVFKARQGREWINLSADDVAKLKNISQGVADNWIKDKTAAGLPAQDYVNFIKERVTYWSQQKNK